MSVTASAPAAGTVQVSVSVAMCTYNGERHLQAQLDSILQQSQLPNEMVIADDGSSDTTQAILGRFAATAPFTVRVIGDRSNLGVTHNFERALRACTGDIVVLSDQDDIWHRDRIATLTQAFRDQPSAGYAFSDAEVFDGAGPPAADSLWQRIGFNAARRHEFQNGNQTLALLNGGNFTYGMSMAIRADCLPWVLPIDSASPSCTHDTWSALVLSAAGRPGIALEQLLVKYRQHQAQVVGAGEAQPSAWQSFVRSMRGDRCYDPLLPDALEAIARRVAALAGDQAETHEARQLLIDKAMHLRNRRRADASGLFIRARIIAVELASGRYHRFSASWKTALRDLIA
ncbi:glycosyltransferase [Aquabacterium sp. OR-4]|uniref:glycosyltransferase n=1 Tax=Aquabacterium sp. OR-4 TaxID=2978127 RepID=UPI0028C864C8|nr:glycosyltransferase [Aquabacterium sp. OR-4]MDT7834491.1 glycosyltransferase [Aquabacterium sp. OR-4]